LQARISWDRVNNRLIARRGSRMVAVLNSGTIPDRGYFAVYLKDSNIRLGEVEEEFVFESRVGETFFLGNSEWRIDSIRQSRIIVTPVAAIKPKAPFWMGDTLFRDYATSKKIGRFRQKLLEYMDRGTATDWLTTNYSADSKTAANLVHYIQRQREHNPAMPTDRQFVVETTINADGQPVFFLHAPLGARTNGAWAVALAAVIERHWQTTIQYSFDDDGIMMRLPDVTEPPPIEKLFKLSPEEIEENLISALAANPIFAVQFRYNAARALLLPRSQPKKRIPLWLQRLRAADLLQAVQQYPDFPVISETYRECLYDVFDLTALKKVIRHINAGRIQIRLAETPYPSPMAANIMFKFVATYLYEADKTRQPQDLAGGTVQYLTEILDQEQIPTIVTPALIHQAESRWQYLAPEYKARSAEDIFDIIEKLGPVEKSQLLKRSKENPTRWLTELKSANRIHRTVQKQNGQRIEYWVVSSRVPRSNESPEPFQVRQRIQLYLTTTGPVSAGRIRTELKLSAPHVRDALNRLHREKKVVCGQLTVGYNEVQWCDRQNFLKLYRMAIAGRRRASAPAVRKTFIRFLFEWHRINKPGQSLIECVQRYRGLRFPVHFFERNVLVSRFRHPHQAVWVETLAELDDLISNGKIIVLSSKTGDSARRYVQFRLRGEGSIFSDRDALVAGVAQVGRTAKTVFDFLTENGASYVRDIELGTGLSRPQLQRALRELADHGLASCDDYKTFLMVLQSVGPESPRKTRISGISQSAPFKKASGRHTRSAIRKMVQEQSHMREGRWFLTTAFAIMGQSLTDAQRATTQARLLLQRYGILVKEFYRRESGLLPWYSIFQSLKRLEWQGEIRRGYFVEGLSGVQFAMPEALDLLEKIHNQRFTPDKLPVVLSSMDPALPFGGTVDWNMKASTGTALKIIRLPANHIGFRDAEPVIYGENLFRKLSSTADLSGADFEAIARFFSEWLKLPPTLRIKNRIEILQINDHPAASGKFASQLLNIGYAKEGQSLILWPSAV
jgi:ATP-dependent Lhr-like helicase